MIAQDEIIRVAELKVKEINGFLVDVKVNTANVITVFFDRMEGVQVENCLEVSKHIEEYFELHIEISKLEL